MQGVPLLLIYILKLRGAGMTGKLESLSYRGTSLIQVLLNSFRLI